MLKTLFAVVALATFLPAQSPLSVTPGKVGDVAGVWLVYADRAEFATPDGVVTSMKSTPDDKEGRFITRWKDATGFEHEVVTDYGGKTAGGIRAAAERHKSKVDEMVRLFGGPK